MYVVTKYFGKILANNHLEGVKFHIPFQNLMQRGMLTHMGSRKSQAKFERARVRTPSDRSSYFALYAVLFKR